ncbi:MAG TPA: carboxypeptidase regulatory-like domain-containing protein [Candidatus Saccharimonadales bacterium]|nr:carboxypeptidase regulatory-like domain-containing protein [Candidatus Saccharimonadales bacterium]
MKKVLILTTLVLAAMLASEKTQAASPKPSWWDVQSIDTMKMSRDLAREKLGDKSYDASINLQVEEIAEAGATHIAVGTPYDPEFIPYLARWVKAARLQGLHVWFRGNFSGWEGWFDYPKISRQEHLAKTRDFIINNFDLFEDGDIFTSCPECENGGPGDPRLNGDIVGHRKFLIDEYDTTKAAFLQIHKNVTSNYFSMNGDVARVIMDKNTTAALDGVVTIDHYVATPTQLANDIEAIATQSGGKIVLGEFGAPIPDLNGNLDEVAQAKWIEDALSKLTQLPEVVAINYWTNVGSSTNLWNDNFTPRKAVQTITKYYSPRYISGRVEDELGEPVASAIVQLDGKIATTDKKGRYELSYIDGTSTEMTINALGYDPSKTIFDIGATDAVTTLKKNPEDLIFKIKRFFYNLLH